MAKIIKYQLASEVVHNVIVEVPLLDENGNPVMNEIVTPVTEDVTIPVLDENGEPVLDENGEPMVKVITQPVYDENGEPVVVITYEPVLVEEMKQETEVVLSDTAIECATQKSLDANLPIVQKEAYNGVYEIEGEFDPEPAVVATHNIVAGEYITVNGVLYLATENIPNGEPIIVGQNAIETTVEEQLYELKGE